jgi:hypothetical protein
MAFSRSFPEKRSNVTQKARFDHIISLMVTSLNDVGTCKGAKPGPFQLNFWVTKFEKLQQKCKPLSLKKLPISVM